MVMVDVDFLFKLNFIETIYWQEMRLCFVDYSDISFPSACVLRVPSDILVCNTKRI